MQCAYNLVPSNFNGMILVIALEQQKQLFHVGKCNAIWGDVSSSFMQKGCALRFIRNCALYEDRLCNSADLTNIQVVKQIIVLS